MPGENNNTVFCTNCGKAIPAGIAFCPYCGTACSTVSTEPAPVANPQPVPEQPVKITKDKKKILLPVIIVAALLVAVLAITSALRGNCLKAAEAKLDAGDLRGAQEALTYPGTAGSKLGEYIDACLSYDERQYLNALSSFKKLGDFKDSEYYVGKCQYSYADECESEGNYAEALHYFGNLKETGFEDSILRYALCGDYCYDKAVADYQDGNYEEAKTCFSALDGSYELADDYLFLIQLQSEESATDEELARLETLLGFEDSKQLFKKLGGKNFELFYEDAVASYQSGNYEEAEESFEMVDRSYERTDDYLFLIEMHTNGAQTTDDDLSRLTGLIGFEDAGILVFRDFYSGFHFMQGVSSCKDGYYFNFNIRGGNYYFDGYCPGVITKNGGSYSFYNGFFLESYTPVATFKALSENTVEIVSLSPGNTYQLTIKK